MSVWLSHHFHALAAAIKRLTRTPTGSLLSIAVIGIAFSLPAGIYVLLENLQSLSGQFSGAPQLSLFLKLDADSEAVAEIESRLKQHPDVGRFTFIPKGARLSSSSRATTGAMSWMASNEIPCRTLLYSAPEIFPGAPGSLAYGTGETAAGRACAT